MGYATLQVLCEIVQEIIGCDMEPFVYPYMDDFLILTPTFEKHIEILTELAERLNKANLTISIEKSKFCVRETPYVGYLISEDGIKANPERMRPIFEYPAPKNLKALRRFIGMCGWYRRFIPNYATLIAPITNLLKKCNIPFRWTPEAQESFVKLKEILVSPQVLSPPDFSLPFTIQCDASLTGIGSVLTQNIDGDERVISYYSGKLNNAQINYTVTEKECLAVILSIEKFRPYIDGVKFTIITDHASLLWLKNQKEPTSRLARWSLRLQAYDFDILHRKGSLHVVPDALSRLHMDEENTSSQIPNSSTLDDIDIECNAVSFENFSKTIDTQYTGLVNLVKASQLKGDQLEKFKYQNELLYIKDKQKYGYSWLIYVPFDCIENVIQEGHDNILSGHGGFFKTLKRIRQNYYWPTMRDDISKYVQNCKICQSAKPNTTNSKSPMGALRITEYPWRAVALDFVGPLPRTKNGHAWILTMVDIFSKYTIAVPLRTATSDTLIKHLRADIFLTKGVPEYVICDNGSQFISHKFAEFLKSYNVNKKPTAAYTARQNPSECYNKIIGTALKMYIDQKQHNTWDVHLTEIVCSINTSTHTVTKKSPYELIYGGPMILDGQFHRLSRDVNNTDPDDRPTKLTTLWEDARAAMAAAFIKYKSNYDKTANKNLHYQIGEFVWKKNTTLSNKGDKRMHKLMPRFIKCKIIAKNGPNMYRLADAETMKDLGLFSTDMLSKYRSSNRGIT